MHITAIVVAAGRGTRMGGGTPKAFVQLGGAPMMVYALRTLVRLSNLGAVILVVAAAAVARAREALDQCGPWPIAIEIVPGGAERQDSVAAGLARVVTHTGLVLVHDAARPFVSLAAAAACASTAAEHGAAIVAVPAHDTVKLADDHRITQTLDRQRVWLAQTPQVFHAALLREACAAAQRDRVMATDDAALVERLGTAVHIVPGEPTNRKITTPDDLRWAEWHLATRVATS